MTTSPSLQETQPSGMLDNSPFIPAMPSPLMAMSSTEVTQRTVYPAAQSIEKDASPFASSTATFPIRPMFGDASYTSPSHSILPLDRQVGFLNPSTYHGTIGGSVTTAEDRTVNGFHGSAFLPAKCLKLERPTSGEGELPSYRQGSNNNPAFPGNSAPLMGLLSPLEFKEECTTDKESPSPATTTPEVAGALSETPVSDGTDSNERSTPEDGRVLRRLKKRSPFDGQSCPICGVTVRLSELSVHLQQEVERLTKISRSMKRPLRERSPHNRSLPSVSTSKKKDGTSPSEKGIVDSRWETYQRVKSNRQNRLNSVYLAARAYKGKKRKPDEATCPVCNEKLTGSPEELNAHVERCLRKKETAGSEEEMVDIEGDDSYEEYEWAGQTRIRATSLLQGGFSASGFQVAKHSAEEEDDQDLNVDGDDSGVFGQPQYSEVDIIPCSSDEPAEDKERQQLRKAVITESTSSPHMQTGKWTANGEGKSVWDNQEATTSTTLVEGPSYSQPQETDHVIVSLKEKIREQEEHLQSGDRMKCLICMETYMKPVVSVCCWHVHCEECWLRTLGAKKLCPQCNMITSPSDLRRIYL